MRTLRLAMLHLQVPFHNDCIDRLLQSYLLHTSAETNLTTNTMGGQINGILSQVTTQERKQDGSH